MHHRPVLHFETERLRNGSEHHVLSVKPADCGLEDDPEYVFNEPIQLDFTLTLVGNDSVLLRGSIRTIGATSCARCLESIRVPLSAQLTLHYSTDERLKDEVNFPELQEDSTFWYDGEFIEPADQLREQLLLELPTVPACQLDARDICPITGRKMGSRTFGPVEEPVEAENENSLAAQLKRMMEQKKNKDKK